jgi:hypothetical protein
VRGLVAIFLVACGSKSGTPSDGPSSDSDLTDAIATTDGATDATLHDAAVPTIDAFPGVLDVRINCHDDCTLIAMPAKIDVSAGTGFEVNWINTGDTECDVDKVDQFNQVPIIIGLEPGTSYHDPVHTWCGAQFTGTFEFRVDICTLPSYIPVDCGA